MVPVEEGPVGLDQAALGLEPLPQASPGSWRDHHQLEGVDAEPPRKGRGGLRAGGIVEVESHDEHAVHRNPVPVEGAHGLFAHRHARALADAGEVLFGDALEADHRHAAARL